MRRNESRALAPLAVQRGVDAGRHRGGVEPAAQEMRDARGGERGLAHQLGVLEPEPGQIAARAELAFEPGELILERRQQPRILAGQGRLAAALPPGLPYRVLLVRRRLDEVLASQRV